MSERDTSACRAPRRWIRCSAVAIAATLAGMQPLAAAGPDVVVTVKPVHGIVAAVMDGVGAPHLLLDGAASPHTYAMKPSEVRRLNAATVVVRVSARLEVFLTKPLSLVAKRTRIVTLDEVPGLTLHKVRVGGDFEPHRHDHGHAKGKGKHDHGHGHGHAHGKSHEDDAKQTDGHLWLDPQNARIIALHVSDVLAAVSPADAARFKANAKALAERLEALDQALQSELAPVVGKPFLVFHDAYQYFERRYGLAGAGSVTVNPEVPPSARRLSQLRERLSRTGIVCVFAEPQFAPRAVDTIIEGTNVRRATLDPLGSAIGAGPDHYFEMMEGLARDLKGCLAGSV
jgi:zinc transport system substrate-binding protein